MNPFELEPTGVREARDGFERWRLWAFPVAFAILWLLSGTRLGGLLRVFFGMWLHELGHALMAWGCGRWAVPLPWVTVAFERSWLVSLVVFGGALTLAVWSARRARLGLAVVAGVVLVAAAVGHLLSPRAQQAVFAFGGDAGAMVLGAALACGFLVRASHPLFREGLRLGWLVIGSASWADATRTWWTARWDVAEIPFGVESFGFGGDGGGMPSDASRLVDECGWDAHVMVTRFLVVAGLSLLGCAVAFVAALRRERCAVSSASGDSGRSPPRRPRA
jgi:hypothetical protein